MPKNRENAVSGELEKMAAGLAESLDFNLLKVSLERQAGKLILRFILDKPGGIMVKDCENFSRKISKILDQADFIRENYFLEVASPGIQEV